MESHAKGKRILRLFLNVVAGAAIGLVAYWLTQEPLRTPPEPEPGQFVIAFQGDLTTRASARGRVLPQRQANLTLNIAGRVAHVFVQVGDEVEAGDILVQLETDALERAVRLAEQNLAIQEARLAELRKGASTEDIAIAQAAVDSAQAQLDQLRAGPQPEEIAAAEGHLRAAQAVLWGTAEQRDQVAAGATEAEIAAAQTQIADALAQQKAATDIHDWTMRCETRINDETGKKEEYCPRLGTMEENARFKLHTANEALAAAQAQLNLLLAGPSEEQLDGANSNVSAAVGQRDAAQAQLDLLQSGSSAYQITIAEASVTQAEATLAALKGGPSDEQLAIVEAQVEQARIALEEALDNLADATLVSPLDGAITAVYVSIGEFASGPVVELVDFDSLELVLDIDEIEIGAVETGQKALLSLEAWQDEDLTGKVVSIAPKSSVGETVTYPVHVSLEAARERGLPIRPGMSATAELVTSHKENVLLVPNVAIIADRETGLFYVNVWEQEIVVLREVTTGLRDSRYTEIIAGLEVGDELFIEDEGVLELLDLRQGLPREIRELRQ